MTTEQDTRLTINSFFSEIKTTPGILQNSRYPSLDGLRGIAILMVIIAHLSLSTDYYYITIFNGHLGVLIFFVLSGFLITTLCIKEKVASGDVSLKKFYMRRVLRILPVAYLYLIVLVIFKLVFKMDTSYINILGAAFFLMNFSSYFRKYNFSWYTAHYWSLAVEEQFYLIFPIFLKKQFKAYLVLLVFIAFIVPLIICLQYFVPLLNTGILYAFTHFAIKFEAISVGCLFSVIAFKYPEITGIFSKNKVLGNIIAFLLILLVQYDDFLTLQSMFSGILISLLIGYIIISNITPARDIVFRFLNTKLLKWIGVLSYSIYIWQQFFMATDPRIPHFLQAQQFRVLWILIISCLSYYFYESYFLKLRTKFKSASA